MNDASDDSEKTHDATEKKIQAARDKGDIARPSDVNGLIGYVGFGATLAFAFPLILQSIQSLFQAFESLNSAHLPLHTWFDVRWLLLDTMFKVSLPLIVPLALILAFLISRRSISFSYEKVAPKLSRVSIIENLKSKMGATGLVDFIRNALKLLVFSSVSFVFVLINWQDLISLLALQPMISLATAAEKISDLLLFLVCSYALFAALDWIVQDFRFKKRNMMSHRELKDELKEDQGDQTMKAARRSRHLETTTHNISDAVRSADVVVVNPTHFAVVLEWDRSIKSAPVCTAKGQDHVAANIIKTAREANVAVYRDPPTARALYATTEIGKQISSDMYENVAAAIRFADSIEKKGRK